MANARNGNSWYVDTSSGTLGTKNYVVYYVTVTATSSNGVLVLQDNAATAINKIDLRVPTSGSTVRFNFSDCPLVFPNGIKAGTVTNCNATIIGREQGTA